MVKIGSDISSSEDELLTGERVANRYSPLDKEDDRKLDTKSEKDDDRMSLSSLSSNEPKIEESKIDSLHQSFSGTHFHPYQQYSGITTGITS